MQIQHLPYAIDETKSKNHYYETLWKITALKLLVKYHSKDLADKRLTLLDYGCGRGETMRLATEARYCAYGADIDDTCLSLSSRWGTTFKLTENIDDVRNLFEGLTFDVITCFHVLEHVQNPLSLLKQLREVSNKYILIAVPNLRQLHGLRRDAYQLSNINEGHLYGWDHWHFLNLATIHAKLKLVEWASDAVTLPYISNLVQRLFGMHFAIRMETGIFRKIFPFHCHSVIGLFENSK